jgi:hypothetical protein
MNTHCQPIDWAATGSSRIDAMVSRNPVQVCSVSAVPT